MHLSLMCRPLVAACLILASLPAAAGDAVPMPVLQTTDEFREILVRAGDDLYIAGQPTAQGLREMAAAGVTTVVNLRTAQEMDNRDVVSFDEAALLHSLDIRYVHIPSGGPDTAYAPDMVAQFDEALRTAKGGVLLHCTVAWRASHLYTAWLYRYGGLTLKEAVDHGRAINLGQLPLEGFLDERLIISVGEQP